MAAAMTMGEAMGADRGVLAMLLPYGQAGLAAGLKRARDAK